MPFGLSLSRGSVNQSYSSSKFHSSDRYTLNLVFWVSKGVNSTSLADQTDPRKQKTPIHLLVHITLVMRTYSMHQANLQINGKTNGAQFYKKKFQQFWVKQNCDVQVNYWVPRESTCSMKVCWDQYYLYSCFPGQWGGAWPCAMGWVWNGGGCKRRSHWKTCSLHPHHRQTRNLHATPDNNMLINSHAHWKGTKIYNNGNSF